jgi:uncharacterized membrane protein
MPFCANCGAQVEGRFCAKCGTPAQAAETPGASPGAQPGGQPYAAPVQAQPMADNVASMLCYILGFITGIIFLALQPYNQNRTVRFHAFQSIFLSVALFAVWIALWIIDALLIGIHLWSLLPLMGIISTLVWLGGLMLTVLLMVKAYQGQAISLPVIGDLARKQAQ